MLLNHVITHENSYNFTQYESQFFLIIEHGKMIMDGSSRNLGYFE